MNENLRTIYQGNLSATGIPAPFDGLMTAAVSEVSSILIVRLSAIGDIVMASPMINALSLRYPNARISWLVQPESKGLLDNDTQLDEVIVWPRNQWRDLWKQKCWGELWREILGFRRELRKRRFDLVIDLQGLLKSGLLAWLSGAGERIGLGSREGSQLLMSRVFKRGGDPDRIGSEYLYLAQCLGLPSEPFDMRLTMKAADEDFITGLVADNRLDSGYCVIAPFTTRPQKHWFETSWIALIPRLRQRFNMPVIILGGPGDTPAAQRIANAVDEQIINLAGITTLGQAAAAIKTAKLLIGVDTGLTHMGIALNRPTVALFGSTCPYQDTTRENAKVLYHRFPCSPCKRHPVCHGEFSCMAAINGDEVLATAETCMHQVENAST